MGAASLSHHEEPLFVFKWVIKVGNVWKSHLVCLCFPWCNWTKTCSRIWTVNKPIYYLIKAHGMRQCGCGTHSRTKATSAGGFYGTGFLDRLDHHFYAKLHFTLLVLIHFHCTFQHIHTLTCTCFLSVRHRWVLLRENLRPHLHQLPRQLWVFVQQGLHPVRPHSLRRQVIHLTPSHVVILANMHTHMQCEGKVVIYACLPSQSHYWSKNL